MFPGAHAESWESRLKRLLENFWPKLAKIFLHEIIATLTLKSVWKFTAVLVFEFHMNRGEFVPVQKKCTSALWGGCV